MVLTSARFESHFCTAVSGPHWQPINRGQQKGIFTLPEGSLFIQAVSFSRAKQQLNTQILFGCLETPAQPLGQTYGSWFTAWESGYRSRKLNFLVNKTGPFLMFVPVVLTVTQECLCCCLTLIFALLHLWSWALQLQPNLQRPAFATHVASITDRMSTAKTTVNSFTDCLDSQTGFPPSLSVSCL